MLAENLVNAIKEYEPDGKKFWAKIEEILPLVKINRYFSESLWWGIYNQTLPNIVDFLHTNAQVALKDDDGLYHTDLHILLWAKSRRRDQSALIS